MIIMVLKSYIKGLTFNIVQIINFTELKKPCGKRTPHYLVTGSTLTSLADHQEWIFKPMFYVKILYTDFYWAIVQYYSVKISILCNVLFLFSLYRASISKDPFYDMLATRKRRIANKK